MEIPKSWLVQDYVTGFSAGKVFKTTEIIRDLGFTSSSSATHVLNKMRCVGKVHSGKVRLNGSLDRNIYVKLSGGGQCKSCSFEESGNSGCVIQRQDLRKLFEDNI